jgi:nucleotide-binding universal stress UspA family protein
VEPILVPTDFTPAAASAVKFALKIARKNKHEIKLLHVISKPVDKALKKQGEELISSIEKKIHETTAQLVNENNIDLDFIVRKGSIFHEINKTAQELNSELVVMGNHGVTNFYQHLFSPYAVRLAAKSTACYLLVNEYTESATFKNIILPVDEAANQENKLSEAIKFAKQFNSTVHLLIRRDENMSVMQEIRDNAEYFREELNKAGIMFFKMPQPVDINFTDLIINYAEESEADLIVLNVYNYANISAGNYRQEFIINNSKNIAVLCVPG